MDAEKPVMTERSKAFSQTARVVLVALLMATALADNAAAGPVEDAESAYDRGDYVEAVKW